MRALILCVCAAVSMAAAAQDRVLGLFRAPVAVNVGGRSGDLVLADINRDGDLDLVVAQPPDPVIAVQFGDGNGAFTPMATGPSRIPGGVAAMTVGDLNGDRAPDLVVANRDEQREYVAVLLGDGTGRFVPAGLPYATATTFAFYKPVLRIRDVNEDGHMDVVSTNGRRNSLELLFGDGRGRLTYGPRVMLEPGGSFYTSDLADIDGDGHLDLLSSMADPDKERVILQTGNGKGGFRERKVIGSARFSPRVVALHDVTGDERIDVVLAHGKERRLTVLLNGGRGGFRAAAGSPYALPGEAFELAVADINGDGQTDLAAAVVDSQLPPYPGGIAVLLGGARGFAPAAGSPISAGRGSYHLAFGDINDDGRVDFVVSSFEGDPVTLLLGR